MTTVIKSWEEYQKAVKESAENPSRFWAEQAESFTWHEKWDDVVKWDFETPNIEWFRGGKLNITENCLDRHLETRGNQVAFYWEPNDPEEDTRRLFS